MPRARDSESHQPPFLAEHRPLENMKTEQMQRVRVLLEVLPYHDWPQPTLGLGHVLGAAQTSTYM